MMKLTHSLGLTVPLAAVLFSGVAAAETINGRINGHGCAHGGMSCPVDRLDPHVALESNFVLQKADGDYYFLSNVPRSTKARYVLEEAQVTGTLDDKYRSIVVDEFKIKKGGAYKTVWTQKAQSEEWEYLYGGGTWFPATKWQQAD